MTYLHTSSAKSSISVKLVCHDWVLQLYALMHISSVYNLPILSNKGLSDLKNTKQDIKI